MTLIRKNREIGKSGNRKGLYRGFARMIADQNPTAQKTRKDGDAAGGIRAKIRSGTESLVQNQDGIAHLRAGQIVSLVISVAEVSSHDFH
jgi:hypothetical protein